jgi:uncharacterized protein YbjQ (UPF0145 family)
MARPGVPGRQEPALSGPTLIASGNINEPYLVLGMVHAVVTRPAKRRGCGELGGLPVEDAYREAARALHASALKSGGDGVIHVGFEHRISSTTLSCNQTAPVFEVYGWGTAIKLEPERQS